MKDIVIVGYGGHGKSVADAIERTGQYHIVGYTDLQPVTNVDYPYLGDDEHLTEIFQKGTTQAAIGVGYLGRSNLRDKLATMVKEIGFEMPVIIDPAAVVSAKAEIGEGTFVGKNAVINAEAKIGKMCIINTGAIIEHENQIGDYTHVAVATTICGQVKIADHCFIGAGSTVIQNVSIGKDAIVAAGTTVIKDIAEGVTYYGLN